MKARRVPKARMNLNAIVLVCVFVVEGNVFLGGSKRGEVRIVSWGVADGSAAMGWGGSTQDIGVVTTLNVRRCS